MTWTWVAETVDGQPLGELTEARSRKLTVDLGGPATATFDLDGRTPQALELAELTTDLFIWHDRDPIFRGRIGSTDDDLDADRHTTSWSAVDYRGILDARIYRTDITYQDWQQDDIAWNAIHGTQTDYPGGGDLGITRGDQHADPALRTYVVEADTKVSSMLNQLGSLWNGFDWWIDASLRFQAATYRGVWRPDFPLAWGGNVTKLKRSYDTGKFANWVRVRGSRPEGASMDDPEPMADRWAPDIVRPEGRIMRVETNSDLKDQDAVDAYAEQLLADSLVIPSAYTATLTPGIWQGPAQLWVGDTLPIVVRSGRLDISTTGRIAILAITIDDEGEELVEVTFGHS